MIRKPLFLLTIILVLAAGGLALMGGILSTTAQAASETFMSVASVESRSSDTLALGASVVHTWTHTTRADWEQGEMELLDTATISGSVQLMQRLFADSTTITPRADLASGQRFPDIAIDSAGNFYAAWADGRNGHTDIYFSYRAAISTAWSTSVKVTDDFGSVQPNSGTAIAVDGSGNVYIVWTDIRNDDKDIYFATRPAGGDWGANVRINDDVGATAQQAPDIAVDSAGQAYAVWWDERNSDPDIYFATRLPGGNWGTNIRVNDDAGAAPQFSPAIAIDPGGNAYAVWADERSGDMEIWSSTRPADGGWEANTRVSDHTSSAGQFNPDIAVDTSGNAYAVWENQEYGGGYMPDSEVYFAMRPAGGNWGVNAGVNSGWYPDIAVDASGNAYAILNNYDNDRYDIYLSTGQPEVAGDPMCGSMTTMARLIRQEPLSLWTAAVTPWRCGKITVTAIPISIPQPVQRVAIGV